MPTATPYESTILRYAPTANPRHVEAWMRIEHGTLDHLTPTRFKAEVGIALACIAEAGEAESEALAKSFGF